MWATKPIIFEDEDEEALKSEFVRLSALYPNRDKFEIASYLFRNQVDPELRSQQAAMIWAQDLDILERIRLTQLNGGKEPEAWTKERIQKRIQATIEDETINYHEKKVRIEGYMALAQTEGLVVKSVEKKVDKNVNGPARQIVFMQRRDE